MKQSNENRLGSGCCRFEVAPRGINQSQGISDTCTARLHLPPDCDAPLRIAGPFCSIERVRKSTGERLGNTPMQVYPRIHVWPRTVGGQAVHRPASSHVHLNRLGCPCSCAPVLLVSVDTGVALMCGALWAAAPIMVEKGKHRRYYVLPLNSFVSCLSLFSFLLAWK